LFVAALFLALLFGTASHSFAQSTSGTILGEVHDSSGGAIPNAAIIITNSDTGVVRNATGNADGLYNVPSLLPGRYVVEGRAQGFGTSQVKDIVLRVGSEAQVNLILNVSSTTQSVTVTEAIPVIDTTSAEVSQVMDDVAIESVPLNARDVQSLAAIQPAVQSAYGSGYGNRNIAIAGDRPVNNRFLQEGVDTTSVYHNSSVNLASNIMLGVEAVKEFKVLTSNLPAEYGEQSGGVINTLFKSGTNGLHGSAYEYYRNGVFDARNPFDTFTDSSGNYATPPLHRHQFGASLGGPIKKDRTFYFVNYEGLRQDDALSFQANVPDALARGLGSAPGFAQVPCSATTAGCGSGASALPASSLVTVKMTSDVQNIFFGGANPLYPVCNGPSVGGGLCLFSSNPVEKVSENYWLAKIDHNVSAKNSISASYNMDRGWVNTPGPLGNTTNDRVDNRQTFTFQDTHIVSANVVNTLRFGVTRIWLNDQKDMLGSNGLPGTDRFDPRILPVHISVPCATICGVSSAAFPSGPTTPLPTISIAGGMSTFGASARAANFDPRWFGYTPMQVSDDVNYLHGKHAIQFGVQFKRIWDNLAQYRGNPVGTWSFSNLGSFLGGGPANSFGVDVVDKGFYGRSWATNLYGLYTDDTYKLRSNLTFTLGLRWEYVPGPSERNGQMANIYNPTPLLSVTPAIGKLYYGPKDNFAPRFGFNWDPLKDGKTSVRGGFGITYNEIWDDTFFTGGTAQYPFVTSITGLSDMVFPFSQAVFDNDLAKPSVSGAKPTFGGSIQLHPQSPRKYGYNLSLQRELPGRISLLVGYVGSRQVHQGRSESWQEYAPATIEVPGQVPMINGVPITYGVYTNGVQTGTVAAPINPSCTEIHQAACLYWAGVGTTNANVTGTAKPSPTFTGTSSFLAPLGTNPYATLCTATQTANCFNNQNYGNSITDIVFDAKSFYDAFVTAVERRMSPGLFVRFNYSLSKCITDAIGDRGGGASNGGGNAWTPTTDSHGSRARCAFQAYQAANFSFSYDLPFGKMVGSHFAKDLLNGWQISSVTQAQGGFPFEVRLGANVSRAAPSGAGNQHPDWAAPSAACPNPTPEGAVNPGNVTNYVNAACFAIPPAGYLGNVPSLVLTGPRTWQTDVSLKRNIVLREGKSLLLSGDMFNAFNHTNLAPPDQSNVYTTSLGANTTVGQITRTVSTSRQFQIGARFQF